MQHNLLVVVSSLSVFSIAASVAAVVLLVQKQQLKREPRDAKNQLKQKDQWVKQDIGCEKTEVGDAQVASKTGIMNGNHLPRRTESSTPSKTTKVAVACCFDLQKSFAHLAKMLSR